MSQPFDIVPALFEFVTDSQPQMYGDVLLPPARPVMTGGVVSVGQDALGLAAAGNEGAQGEANCQSNSVNSSGVSPARQPVAPSGAAARRGQAVDRKPGAVGRHPVHSVEAGAVGRHPVPTVEGGALFRHSVELLPACDKISAGAVALAASGLAAAGRVPVPGRLSVVVAAMVAADPPACNTGGQSASVGNLGGQTLENSHPVSLKPDYFNFTIPCLASSELEHVERLKGLLGAEWQVVEGSMYRYQSRVRCGNVWILWNGIIEGMGVHVQISGQGISELEARGVTDWRAWLSARLKEGARFSRVDSAFDVQDGSLTIEQVETAARAGLVSSHFDTLEPVIKFDGKGEVTARGFNFGNRSADTSICFYDKALEQRRKKLEQEKQRSGKDAVKDADLVDASAYADKQAALEEQWTRCELRNRNARAQELVKRIVTDGWAVVAGVLAAAMDVKERGEASQRCRWQTADWWAAFIGWAEKARLKLDPIVRTLQSCMVALERQYGPVLSACDAVVPNFWGWLLDVAARRRDSLSSRHRSMMDAYAGMAEGATPAGNLRPSGVNVHTGEVV